MRIYLFSFLLNLLRLPLTYALRVREFTQEVLEKSVNLFMARNGQDDYIYMIAHTYTGGANAKMAPLNMGVRRGIRGACV